MSLVLLDGTPWEEGVEADALVSDVLNSIDVCVRESGRIVSNVQIDGELAVLNKIGDMKLSAVEKIEVHSDTAAGFATETSLDARNYSIRLVKGFEDFCEKAKAGDDAGALVTFRECLPGLDWLSQVVPRVISILVPEDKDSVLLQEVADSMETYTDVLKGTLDIMEAGELFESADHIQHELIPIIWSWSSYLERALVCSGAKLKEEIEQEEKEPVTVH